MSALYRRLEGSSEDEETHLALGWPAPGTYDVQVASFIALADRLGA
jgi:hypothetical protein